MVQSTSPVQFNIQVEEQLTWNVKPLLHEIRHALEHLIATGEGAIIDLRSIPLAPGEEEKILKVLGQGEVAAKLDVLGPSEVIETAYSGVWVVTHYNDDNDVIGRFIEITAIPEILRSQKEDMQHAYNRLAEELQDEQENSDSSVEKSA